MSNVNYTFVENEGSIVFRSSVNSFGLDHVSDKSLLSFYTRFSSSAFMDTGLMPVDGSGLLSIRTAGNHTQIAYQHKPGMYYINWGQYEGDRSAVKYYVAQPYRIIIADILNGNLLGARTFYSPIPVTHPEVPLYHVNLPNINCKGYRGNGVGWICLYHNEDISEYPFNEKLAKIIDRCSGTEAYNDANMSETDGPRFYKDRGAPAHVYDPAEWQSYSEDNGIDWTLTEDIWIPVLVQDMDNQSSHYDKGQPLTFVMALLGNYQAYYTDALIPKPVNAIVRNDLTFSDKDLFSWFKQSYNLSQISTSSLNLDSYAKSKEVRFTHFNTVAPIQISIDDESDEEDSYWYCEDCETNMSQGDEPNTTDSSNFICDSCFENYSYCENTQKYHHVDDTFYLDQSDLHVYTGVAVYLIDYKYCRDCGTGVYKTHPDFDNYEFVQDDKICVACYNDKNTTQSEPF